MTYYNQVQSDSLFDADQAEAGLKFQGKTAS